MSELKEQEQKTPLVSKPFEKCNECQKEVESAYCLVCAHNGKSENKIRCIDCMDTHWKEEHKDHPGLKKELNKTSNKVRVNRDSIYSFVQVRDYEEDDDYDGDNEDDGEDEIADG